MPLHRIGFPSSHEKWNAGSSLPRLEISDQSGCNSMTPTRDPSEEPSFYLSTQSHLHRLSGSVSIDLRVSILKPILYGVAIALGIIWSIVGLTVAMILVGALRQPLV